MLAKFLAVNHITNCYFVFNISFRSPIYNKFIFSFFKNIVGTWDYFTIWYICNYCSSNAVNLTDGLDGLATVPVMLVALSFH